MGKSSWVWLENCDVLRVTTQAIIIEYDGEQIWLPQSQVDEPERLDAGDCGVTIGITEWIANQKDIE